MHKKGKIILCSLSGTLLISGITSSILVPILGKNGNYKIKYKFDDLVFYNKEEIYQYLYQNSTTNNYKFDNTKFIIDDLVFDNKNEFMDYINSNFLISKTYTKRNPSDYLINNAGELSNLVELDAKEKIIDVYKGNNGSSYLERDQAMESYLKTYNEGFTIDGQIFDNLYNAQQYYKDSKLKQLEESTSKVKAYSNGGIEQTKEEIISWLRNNTYRGFEYKGKSFSDLNYEEFLLAMNNLDFAIIDKNIKSISNANKSAYWINQSSTTSNLNYFSGPKYLESSERIESIINLKAISNSDINALFGINSYYIASIINATKLLIMKDLGNETIENQNFNLIGFLSSSFKKLKENKETINLSNIEKLKEKYIQINEYDKEKPISHRKMQDFNSGFENIHSSNGNTMTEFDKALIVFKRLINYAKTFNVPGISGDDFPEFERTIKSVIVDLLKYADDENKNFLRLNLSNGEIVEGAEVFMNDGVSFDDLYSIFLNEDAFYNDGGFDKIVFKIFENSIEQIQNLVDKTLKLSSNLSDINKEIIDLKKTETKTQENLVEKTNKIQSDVADALMQDKTFNEILKIDNSKYTPVHAVIAICSAVWSIGEMASFLSFVNYEAVIDSTHSVHYGELQWKIPFTNIYSKTKANVSTIQLFKAPISYMLPTSSYNQVTNDNQVFEFNNQYFLNKNYAIEELKRQIYLKPEKYLPTKKIFANILGDEKMLDLPEVCDINCEIEHEHISQTKYNENLNKEKEIFLEEIFENKFEKPANEYYLDGFGSGFASKEEAISSMNEKIEDVQNYTKVYTYNINNQKIIKSSTKEMEEFIKNNQLIDTKKVISSDLLETTTFNKLKENIGEDYEIFVLQFYNQKKYFQTKWEAQDYLFNNLNYTELDYIENLQTYQYKNKDFISKVEFDKWINLNIKEVDYA
ncbi:hypothetical protein [Mesoplasma tabanidae]|uniref:Uncharacterized protein n=1 Tax=Mesoplasma tabanidae TaxID=219745 RepID=A0A2K8P4Z2_9MOLU|nr:hypothetical protein [Mesoplasma tabanidae]ATZ21548.1 hypothetical protein MTABA_v1c03450 [Mesoplasma tabanidae]